VRGSVDAVMMRGQLAELHALARVQEFVGDLRINRLLAVSAELGPPFGGQTHTHETGL